MEFETTLEKNIDSQLTKMLGENNSEIKEIMKLDMLDDESLDEEEKLELNQRREKVVKKLQRENEYIVSDLKARNFMTHNNKGELVPFSWDTIYNKHEQLETRDEDNTLLDPK